MFNFHCVQNNLIVQKLVDKTFKQIQLPQKQLLLHFCLCSLIPCALGMMNETCFINHCLQMHGKDMNIEKTSDSPSL